MQLLGQCVTQGAAQLQQLLGSRMGELRQALLAAESELTGGAHMRVHPFADVRDWILGIEGGLLVSLTVSVNAPPPLFNQVMVPFWNSLIQPPPVTLAPPPVWASSLVGKPSLPAGPPLGSRVWCALGDAQYCQSMYEIDVFGVKKTEPSFLSYIDKLQALEKEFVVYDQNQFVDDQAFKALWTKHQADIDKALPPVDKRNPLIIDIGLDAEGRAVKIDYDFNYGLPELKARINMKADMLISNYGNATPIDQAQLKRAKTWAETSKGSILEQAMGSFSEKLGQTGIQERSVEPYTLSLDDQLKVIAEQRYDATHAYEHTYKAVFIAKLVESKPQIAQRYSSQELQEIAAVYAYWYGNEDVYNPEGKALKSIEALQKKHHLEQEDQFDDKLGQAVNRIVNNAMHGDQDRQAWKKLQAQYKQPQQLFAQQYQIQFERDNGVSSEEKPLLAQTAAILGQAYVDARKNQLSEKTIKALKIEHNEFIDYEIFKDVYLKMLTAK